MVGVAAEFVGKCGGVLVSWELVGAGATCVGAATMSPAINGGVADARGATTTTASSTSLVAVSVTTASWREVGPKIRWLRSWRVVDLLVSSDLGLESGHGLLHLGNLGQELLIRFGGASSVVCHLVAEVG